MREAPNNRIFSSSYEWAVRRFVPWCLCLVAAILCSSPLLAIDPNIRIDQLFHSAWTPRDGAPADIYSLAQGGDGILWIGAGNGLYRFDGVRFTKFEPESGPQIGVGVVRVLFADAQGALWVGTNVGIVSRIQNGVVTDYDESEGIPRGTTVGFALDGQGTLWVATTVGLARWDHTKWVTVPFRREPGEYCMSIHADRQGELWVGTSDGLFHSRKEGQVFERVQERLQNVESFAGGPDGTLWIVETGRGIRPAPADSTQPTSLASCRIPISSEAVSFDHKGSMWITTTGAGIQRIANVKQFCSLSMQQSSAAGIEKLTASQGLTNDYTSSLLQDREGNIWVGTKGGLDCFRQAPVIPVAVPSGTYNFTLAVDRAGIVWFSSQFGPVGRIEDDKTTFPYDIRSDIAIYADPNGGIWTKKGDLLALYIKGRRIRAIRTPADTGELIAMTTDHSGTLWTAFFKLGAFQFAGGKWTPLLTPGLDSPHVFAEFTDSLDRVWFACDGNNVLLRQGNTLRRISGPENVGVGDVRTVHGDGSDIWIGGTDGVARWDGSRFLRMHAGNRRDFSDVTGVIATHGHGLWMAETSGIIFVPEEELNHFRRDPLYRVICRTFDALDGLPVQLQNSADSPTAVQGPDGRLWFATATGLVFIDPNRIPRDTAPPPVSIESFTANGRNWPVNQTVSLPAHPTSVQISYTAWSLAIPQRVRFRYRLEGAGQSWEEAGNHRETSYASLGPGHYVFHVIASNPDGVWNETGATVTFDVAPAWYQAHLFQYSIAAAVLGLLWVLNSLRVRQATAQLEARLSERLKERERIARELHDTLLQGFDGLVLRFQTAVDQQDHERGRQLMAAALDRADEILVESRERVFSLRAGALKISNLHKALESFAAETAQDRGIRFIVSVSGLRTLHPFVRDEVYRIGREALANAFRHASATAIEVEIDHQQSEFRLKIRDDGVGMDQRVSSNGIPGHWGLSVMRERAKGLGGRLEVKSHLGQGTEITLIVPARAAYRQPHKWFRLPWTRKDLWPK